MLMVPLQPLPSQEVTVILNNQSCRLKVYQKSTGMFIDVYVNDVLIIGGVICEDLTLIVRSIYLPFSGDLAFADVTGARSDPYYTGIGSKYYLFYLLPEEVPVHE